MYAERTRNIIFEAYVEKNYLRDNPRLDSRHALVCKINIHTHNLFAQIFSGFLLRSDNFFLMRPSCCISLKSNYDENTTDTIFYLQRVAN